MADICCFGNSLFIQWYHRRWQEANTTDNFFKWFDLQSFHVSEELILLHVLRLDRGGGKDLSLDECPRERLEQEVRLMLLTLIFNRAHKSFLSSAYYTFLRNNVSAFTRDSSLSY